MIAAGLKRFEVDGSQHSASENVARDQRRDAYMKSVGLQILRFNSNEALKETDAVVDVIARAVQERLNVCAVPLMFK